MKCIVWPFSDMDVERPAIEASAVSARGSSQRKSAREISETLESARLPSVAHECYSFSRHPPGATPEVSCWDDRASLDSEDLRIFSMDNRCGLKPERGLSLEGAGGGGNETQVPGEHLWRLNDEVDREGTIR